jgi:glycosyltransferase involved in cell wall biosynthesis
VYSGITSCIRGKQAARSRRNSINQPSAGPEQPLSVIVIGSMPPWITGQSISTEAIVNRFRRDLTQVIVVNTTPRNFRPKWTRRLSRLPGYLLGLRTLLIGKPGSWTYIVVDADSGMYFNILCATIARLRRMQLLMHHHNYSYIAQLTTRMQLLTWIAGTNATHLTLCQIMSHELATQYPGVSRTCELSNAHLIGECSRATCTDTGQFVIGHLSNLSVEKGLITIINIMRHLEDAGVNAHLRLGGPAVDERAAQIIQAAKAEMPNRLIYDGPLYGQRKEDFYKKISVFVFPSTYRNETEGIVLLEAMSAGVPVIAYGQCCIPNLIGEWGGLAVPMEAPFEQMALPLLTHWAKNPDDLLDAARTARRRYERLRAESEDQLSELLQLMKSRPPTAHEGP